MSQLSSRLAVLLPALAMALAPVAQAQQAQAPQAAAPGDSDINSVYVIPDEIKANDQAQADAIKGGKVESIELRFHMKEAHFRGGMYFEAIHHVPGKADETMGSVNYDDYQYSTGLLKKDFDELWGKMIGLSWGTSILATGGSIALLYLMGTQLEKRKIWLLSEAAAGVFKAYKSGVGKLILLIPTLEVIKWIVGFYQEFETNGQFKIPFTTDAHCNQSFLQRMAGNDQCNKTIQTPWLGFKGKEMAERDWLYRVFDQAFENAKWGTPIDPEQFKVEDAFDRYQKIMAGQDVDVTPATADGSASQQASVAQKPLINTVPMSKSMSFAVQAMSDFFKKYVENNAEDAIPNDGISPQ